MKKLLIGIFLFCFIYQINGQEIKIIKGGVTDSIPVPGQSDSISYSFYAPSDYDPARKWPVVFAFDPEGRGSGTANLFRMAAEEQGYVVVSPNINLKKEPIDTIVNTSVSIMQSVLSNFPVDASLVYTAGLGEGAQVASTVPIFYKKTAGVMAIGNSFVNPDYIDRSNPYMFIGLAGDKDYMVYRIEDFLRFYDDLDFPTDVYYFEGKEDTWPQARVVSNAMTGFTLNAIKNNKREANEEFIRKLFQNELDYAEQLRRTRKYYKAYEKLDRMEEKYEDFGLEDEIKDLMKEVKRSNGFRSQRRDFRQAVTYEKEQQDEYEYLLRSDIMSINFENIGWWAYQVDELNKLKDSPNEAKANMAYRLHGYLDFLSKQRYDAIQASESSINIKIFISVLRTAIAKNDPEAYIKIISLASSDGDYETALLYLEDLLKTGYEDVESLYNIDGTLSLRLTPEFNELIKKYLGESRFYQGESSEN